MILLVVAALGIVVGLLLSAYVRQVRSKPSLAERLRWYSLR